jgi:hypothetical protein
MATQLAEQEYDKFHQKRLQAQTIQSDQDIAQLTEAITQTRKNKPGLD